MPGFNQTGPAGQGPMTGRGFGRCANISEITNEKTSTSNTSNENNNMPFVGRGLGAGRGMGFGRGRRCMGQQARFGGRR